MAATVGWPKTEWGFNPGAYSELRPGCFDVHERVKDMDANGVLAQMNFPTMAGWNGRTFLEGGDSELALVLLQAYNDWTIDEWCAEPPQALHRRRASSRYGTSNSLCARGAPPRQDGCALDQLP